MTGLSARMREAIVGDASHRSALSRFALVLAVLLFAIASVIPDTWSPAAMSPEGDAIVETVLVDASSDGDPLSIALLAAFGLSLKRIVDVSKSDDSGLRIAPHALRSACSFEARGPPGV